MFGKYQIKVIDNTGKLKETISDFISLNIMDELNGAGRWTLTNRTTFECPVRISDMIVAYKDGVQIFNGNVSGITEEYSKNTGSWYWQVSGANNLSLLKNRLVFPTVHHIDYDSQTHLLMLDQYFTYSDALPHTVIKTMIEDNAVNAWDSHRHPNGWRFITGAYPNGPFRNMANVSGKLRFENLYDAVTGIANSAGISIIPIYDAEQNKFAFILEKAEDLSDRIVFSHDMNDVSSFKRITNAPDCTDIIMSINLEKRSTGGGWMWGYSIDSTVPGTAEALTREIFAEPGEQEFNGTLSYDNLKKLSDQEAASRTGEINGFEIELNLRNGAYCYGFDITDYAAGRGVWQSDFHLGNTVGVIFHGEKYTGVMSQIEYNISHGSETITTTIGASKKGAFTKVISDLKNIGKSLNKKNNAEVK